jgi:hypothetical protein
MRDIVYTESGKTPCPNFVRFHEGPKEKCTVKELCVGGASLQHYRSSNWVQNKAGHQAKPLKYFEREKKRKKKEKKKYFIPI